ncbi:MAG TPA: sugar kinase [Dongiaceae bacterium]
MSDKRVLVIGDVMTDIIVKPEGQLALGTDRRAIIRSLPGGSGANQALWLAHFGMVVSFAAKIGQGDLAGYSEMLRHRGVTSRLAGDPDLPTGMLVTILDADGQRSFFTDRGANETLDRSDLPDDLLDGVALLHVSGYALFAERPRAALRALMATARQRRITVTNDPASIAFLEEVGPAAFLDWTKDAAICFPNADEAAMLTGTMDHALQRQKLAAYYPLVVIKRGVEGAEIIGPGGTCLAQLPAPKVDVIDTTGAGDAFLAGYLTAHLAGASLDACLRQGVAAGSIATTQLGGQPMAVR